MVGADVGVEEGWLGSGGADSGQCAGDGDGMSPAVGAGACDGLAQDGGSAGVCHGCACCCHIGAESGSRKLEMFIELLVIIGIVDASTEGDFVHGGAWRVGSSRRLLIFWLLGSVSVLSATFSSAFEMGKAGGISGVAV